MYSEIVVSVLFSMSHLRCMRFTEFSKYQTTPHISLWIPIFIRYQDTFRLASTCILSNQSYLHKSNGFMYLNVSILLSQSTIDGLFHSTLFGFSFILTWRFDLNLLSFGCDSLNLILCGHFRSWVFVFWKSITKIIKSMEPPITTVMGSLQ